MKTTHHIPSSIFLDTPQIEGTRHAPIAPRPSPHAFLIGLIIGVALTTAALFIASLI